MEISAFDWFGETGMKQRYCGVLEGCPAEALALGSGDILLCPQNYWVDILGETATSTGTKKLFANQAVWGVVNGLL